MNDIIESMCKRALKDPYFKELFRKIQINKLPFKVKVNENLNYENYLACLRFADIFSRSEFVKNRNISLKIVSSLFDKYKNDKNYILISKSVLTKLGNFPSLNIINKINENITSQEIEFEEIIKKTFQKAPTDDTIFTDAQFSVFNNLISSNFFSFSAGTSFGKSFLMIEYVKWIINKHPGSNIGFLVPTRALINQLQEDLVKEIKNNDYKIIINPDIPLFFKKRNKNYIFIFTPERLVRFFSKEKELDFLIVDEAQNIVSDDERSPLFYHSIMLSKQNNVKLYFASPNVSNPDIFFELFNNSENGAKEKLSEKVDDLNVTRNKFLINTETNIVDLYLDFCDEKKVSFNFEFKNIVNFIKKVSEKNQSIIYANTFNDNLKYAQMLKQISEKVNDEEIKIFSNDIKEQIHDSYMLADLIEYGIAYHFGGLPQNIRKRTEDLFKSGKIKYLFTTSTLIQGVNLPAKNVFVLNNRIGQRKMNVIEFNNLVGRAGRLTKELFGNVFVVNNKSSNFSKLIDTRDFSLKSQILTGKQNFYKNISASLNGDELTNKGFTNWKKRQISEFASITQYQYKNKIDSSLVENFKNIKNEKAIKSIENSNIPLDILSNSINIKLSMQEKILKCNNNEDILLYFSKEKYKDALLLLFKKYEWDNYENKTSIGNIESLGYYSTLLSQWISGMPLNIIIKNVLNYYKNGNKTIIYKGGFIEFDEDNIIHINVVINQIMTDIENIIRFKIKNYILNYMSLTNKNNNDWENYLNYGTKSDLIIELQKIGFDRNSSIEITKKCKNSISISENGEIDDIILNKENLNEYNLSKETIDQINKII